jgi:hypothetical protein
MPTEPRHVAVNPSPDAARRRLHIHGIKEMPSGYDAEVAELFRDLRSASNLTETDLAARLGTRVEVVQALEQGALYALPPWAETCRIVNGYGALLSLDVRPLLRRIYAQLEAGIVELKPRSVPDLPTMDPPDAEFMADEPPPMPDPPPFQNAGSAPAPWPNGAAARSDQQPQWQGGAPQAPNGPMQNGPAWNSAPQPAPQHPPAWQAPQPQSQPQAWPGAQAPAYPQGAWQGAPPTPQQTRPPQPSPPDYSQLRAEPRAPVSAPNYPPLELEPQAARPAAYQPSPQAAVPSPAPAADKPKPRSTLLKWGLGALVISIVAFGLWMALGNSHGPLGTNATGSSGSGQVLDPDDPRSRKADRLPSPY